MFHVLMRESRLPYSNLQCDDQQGKKLNADVEIN